MPDFNAFQASVEQFMGPYELPAVIFGGIIVAVWLVLAYRALQVHNQSEVAQLDRMLKHHR
jgi:uncharacterized membrane protein